LKKAILYWFFPDNPADVDPFWGRCTRIADYIDPFGGGGIRISDYADPFSQGWAHYCRQRQQLAEHPWGMLKRQRGFAPMLMKGKANVLGEVSLVFIGYNLSRCARILKSHDAFKALLKKYIAFFLAQNRPVLSPLGHTLLAKPKTGRIKLPTNYQP